MFRLVILNGPARSGKDTATRFLLKHFENAGHYKMSAPIKNALSSLLNLSPADHIRYFETAEKDKPSPVFADMTPRQMLISFSENWVKHEWGPEAFGNLAVLNLRNKMQQTDFYIISDGGFRTEWLPLQRLCGSKNILVVQLLRDGCTFEGDSRSYQDMTDIGVPLAEIHNNFDLEIFEMQVVRTVEKWLEKLL